MSTEKDEIEAKPMAAAEATSQQKSPQSESPLESTELKPQSAGSSQSPESPEPNEASTASAAYTAATAQTSSVTQTASATQTAEAAAGAAPMFDDIAAALLDFDNMTKDLDLDDHVATARVALQRMKKQIAAEEKEREAEQSLTPEERAAIERKSMAEISSAELAAVTDRALKEFTQQAIASEQAAKAAKLAANAVWGAPDKGCEDLPPIVQKPTDSYEGREHLVEVIEERRVGTKVRLKVAPDLKPLLEGTEHLPLVSNSTQNIFAQLDLLGCGLLESVMGDDVRSRRVIWANDCFYSMVGFKKTTDELYEALYSSPKQFVHPDDMRALISHFRKTRESKRPRDLVVRLLHRRGYYVDVHLRSVCLGYNGQGLPVFVSLAHDITAKQKQRSAMAVDQRKQSLLNNGYQDMVFEYDANDDRMEQIGNYTSCISSSNKISENFLDAEVRAGKVHPDDVATIEKLLTDRSLVDRNFPAVVKFRLRNNACAAKADSSEPEKEVGTGNNDGYMWHTCSAIAYIDQDSGHLKVVGKFINIDQYENRMRALYDQSKLDVLTELYNSKTMYRHCKSLLDLDGDESHALMIFDINNFSAVNKAFGRAFGDSILKTVAKVLRLTFRHSDYLSRLGDDEFAVMLRSVSRQQAHALAINFLSNLRQQHEVIAHDFAIEGSIGIAVYPDDAPDCERLLHVAYSALGEAKQVVGRERIVMFDSDCVDENISAAEERLRLIERSCQVAESEALACIESARKNAYTTADLLSSDPSSVNV